MMLSARFYFLFLFFALVLPALSRASYDPEKSKAYFVGPSGVFELGAYGSSAKELPGRPKEQMNRQQPMRSSPSYVSYSTGGNHSADFFLDVEHTDMIRTLRRNIPKLPAGETVADSHLDRDGNIWLQFKSGKFAFYNDETKEPIFFDQMKWRDGQAPPSIKKIVASQRGSASYFLLDDGSLEKIEGPFNAAGEFTREQTFAPGTVKNIASGYPGIWIDQGDGKISFIGSDGIKQLPTLPADGVLVSNMDLDPWPAVENMPAKTSPLSPEKAEAENLKKPLPKVSFDRPSEVKIFSAEKLAGEIKARQERVLEFRFIKEEAEKLGVRAWLFGGTAAGYGHYVNWDLTREVGDSRYQPDRFDYDYTNIYRSTQDLDIVVDGTPEQAGKLQAALAKNFPHLQGSKSAWEVRLLKSDLGDKDALLNNPDFLNQHTDSNSTGLIELTDPPKGEQVVRDLRDWQSNKPYFLRDIHEHKLHYYFSPEHAATRRAKEGKNPAILSVIRYLTKAFQYDLELRPEDVKKIQAIIASFQPSSSMDPYVTGWIEKNAKKLIQNSVNIEYAQTKLWELGLTQKLLGMGGNPQQIDSLAWWLNKQPLLSSPTGEGKGRTAAEIFGENKFPADESGRLVVAHEPQSYLALESITRSHLGEPNVLASRAGAAGEMAAFGDGFYTRVGREGARGTGLHIRFALDPRAREGSDFLFNGSEYFVMKNKNAFRVIPESLKIGLVDFFQTVATDAKIVANDRGVIEKLRRQLFTKATALPKSEVAAVAQIVKENLADAERGPLLYAEWAKLPAEARLPYRQELISSAMKNPAQANIVGEELKELAPEELAAIPGGQERLAEHSRLRGTLESFMPKMQADHAARENLVTFLDTEVNSLLSDEEKLNRFFHTWVSFTGETDGASGRRFWDPSIALGRAWDALTAKKLDSHTFSLALKVLQSAPYGAGKTALSKRVADSLVKEKPIRISTKSIHALIEASHSEKYTLLRIVENIHHMEDPKSVGANYWLGASIADWFDSWPALANDPQGLERAGNYLDNYRTYVLPSMPSGQQNLHAHEHKAYNQFKDQDSWSRPYQKLLALYREKLIRPEKKTFPTLDSYYERYLERQPWYEAAASSALSPSAPSCGENYSRLR